MQISHLPPTIQILSGLEMVWEPAFLPGLCFVLHVLPLLMSGYNCSLDITDSQVIFEAKVFYLCYNCRNGRRKCFCKISEGVKVSWQKFAEGLPFAVFLIENTRVSSQIYNGFQLCSRPELSGKLA